MMGAIGKLFHIGADLVLVSAVLAGVKRSSGFSVRTDNITDPTVKNVADQYLGVGERIFDMMQATAVNSQYFKRGDK